MTSPTASTNSRMPSGHLAGCSYHIVPSFSTDPFALPDQGGQQKGSKGERSGDDGDEGAENVQDSGGDSAESKQGEGQTRGPTKSDGGDSPASSLEPEPGGARDASAGAKAKKRAHQKEDAGNRGSGGGGGDGEQQQDEQQQPKRRKGRLVPGSLLLTTLSASDLPNTEKGVFLKQVP